MTSNIPLITLHLDYVGAIQNKSRSILKYTSSPGWVKLEPLMMWWTAGELTLMTLIPGRAPFHARGVLNLTTGIRFSRVPVNMGRGVERKCPPRYEACKGSVNASLLFGSCKHGRRNSAHPLQDWTLSPHSAKCPIWVVQAQHRDWWILACFTATHFHACCPKVTESSV